MNKNIETLVSLLISVSEVSNILKIVGKRGHISNPLFPVNRFRAGDCQQAATHPRDGSSVAITLFNDALKSVCSLKARDAPEFGVRGLIEICWSNLVIEWLTASNLKEARINIYQDFATWFWGPNILDLKQN